MREPQEKSELISDDQRFIGAVSRFGSPYRTYDDGSGALYISRDSMGITGIVRARSWEDAYSICEDEFFPECDLTIDEIVKEYGFKLTYVQVTDDQGELIRWDTLETPDPNAWSDNELFQESYGFRPSGPNTHDKLKHGIYSKDLNGDSLDLLTESLRAELGITIFVLTED